MDNARLVQVTWMDAHSDNDWHDNLDVKPRKIMSVGYLVSDTDDAVVLAGMIDPEPEVTFACTMTIPRVCITHMKTLR